MNAPTPLATYQAMAKRALRTDDARTVALIGPFQPAMDSSYDLLATAHKHGDTYIDLYGTFDCDGYDVQEFTLAGSKVPLWALLPAGSNLLAQLTDWCNDCMPSAEELKEESRQEAAIDRAERNKEMDR